MREKTPKSLRRRREGRQCFFSVSFRAYLKRQSMDNQERKRGEKNRNSSVIRSVWLELKWTIRFGEFRWAKQTGIREGCQMAGVRMRSYHPRLMITKEKRLRSIGLHPTQTRELSQSKRIGSRFSKISFFLPRA